MSETEVYAAPPSGVEDLTIYIDSHEPDTLVDHLQQSKIFQIDRTLLPCGDILIGDLGIERKSASDFASSLNSGRLFRQLILLKRSYRRRILILEGDLRITQIPPHRLNALLLRINGSLNIPVIRSISIEDTAAKIEQLAAQILLHYTGQLRERSMKDNGDCEYFQVFVLAGIPGIGVTRARALLSTLGSLKAVFEASTATLAEVPGIGEFYAEKFARIANFRREFKSP